MMKNNIKNTNKKMARLTETDLRKMIGEAVKKVLNETIGDGSFPNADALIGHKLEDIEKALYKEGFIMDEYGDDAYGNGVVYFTNDDGVTVTVTYPWKKEGEHRYVAGKIEQADVY